MSRNIETLIAVRRRNLLRRLKQALPGGTNSLELKGLIDELKAIDDLALRVEKRFPPWAVRLGILALALLVLAGALALRLPRVHVALDGDITSVRIAANSWTADSSIQLKAGLTVVGGRIESLAAEAADNALRTASHVSSLQVPAGALIEIGRAAGAGDYCFYIRSEADGMLLDIMRAQVPDNVDLFRVQIGKGGQANFCVAAPMRLMGALVSYVALERTLRSDPPPGIYGSSILSGSLTIGETASKRKLNDNDRVRIDALTDATVIVALDKKLRMSLSGVSGNATIFARISLPGEAGENLRPTLLEVARSSPALAALFAALTALMGSLWSIWEKLKSS